MIKDILSLIDIRIYLSVMAVLLYVIVYKVSVSNPAIVIDKTDDGLEKSLKHLDKFYVTNIFYTLCGVFLYIFASFSPVIFLRLMSFWRNKSNNTTFPIDIEFLNISSGNVVYIVSYIVLMLITLVLFKVMLDSLLFHHIIKLHIYLHKMPWYHGFMQYFYESYIINFIGNIYIFIFNISHLRVISDPEDPHKFSDCDLIYENPNIVAWSYFFVELAKNLRIIRYMIIILREILRSLYNHRINYGLGGKLPYIMYFSFALHDIITLKIHYTLYGFIPFFILIIILRIFKFYASKNGVIDDDIARYFYNNPFNYLIQRNILYENPTMFMGNIRSGLENLSILHNITKGNQLEYMANNFQKKIQSTDSTWLLQEKRRRHMSFRYFIMVLYAIMVSYLIYAREFYELSIDLLNINMKLIIIILPLFIITCYFGIKAFRSPRDNIDDDLTLYIYNKYYLRVFWLLILIALWLYWLLIIKAHFILIHDSVLGEYCGIKIFRDYSTAEKISIFNKYFQLCLKGSYMPERSLHTIKSFIESFDIKNIIDENTTVADIKWMIAEVFGYYRSHRRLYNLHKQQSYKIKIYTRVVKIGVILGVSSIITNIINVLTAYTMDPTMFSSHIINTVLHYIMKNQYARKKSANALLKYLTRLFHVYRAWFYPK